MIEKVILENLIYNEPFLRKTLPFIKPDYFEDDNQKEIFRSINAFVDEYNTLPSKEELLFCISEIKTLNEDRFKKINELVSNFSEEKKNIQWLIDNTEKFCQDRHLYNAIRRSILVIDGKDKTLDKGAIPALLSEALGISFDSKVGHDFTEESDKRYDFYHSNEERIPFDIDYLNLITKGGLPKKTLSILLASTGVGKTIVMCHMAARHLFAGKNVLYITMEMAEEKIGERLDANLLNITTDELSSMSKFTYDKKIDRLKEQTSGRLIIKEYPTASAGSGHFRHLLNEIRLKKNFVPDVIYIDYLNICTSSRLKNAGNINSYIYVKAIAEELRGLAVEFNVPVVSATQSNRDGYNNSDIDLTNTSESMGLPATADFMLALITSEELANLNQLMIKQLKNRWNDINAPNKFLIGIDKPRMKLYNLETKAQEPTTTLQTPVLKPKPSFEGFK